MSPRPFRLRSRAIDLCRPHVGPGVCGGNALASAGGGALAIILLALLASLAGATPPAPQPTASEDGTRLTLGGRVLLQDDRDGFISISQVRPSPTGAHFVVIACGYECNDNVGFLFRADGAAKRRFTATWDFILQDKVEWSADGSKLFYYRVNSSGAEPPRHAPAPGWVEVDVASGRKTPAVARALNRGMRYAVFNARDGLVVRAAPGVAAQELGRWPDGTKGITATGQRRTVGRAVWAEVQGAGLTGWVNQSYLSEER